MRIYIDDSGQLHPHYIHGDIFVYCGYWTTDDRDSDIKHKYGVLRRQIYHTKNEVKASSMTEKTKLKILKKIKKEFGNYFNPIFVTTKVSDLTIDFSSKSAVQLHKNYLLRRFVEEAIKDKRNKLGMQFKNIEVFIDDQSKTRLPNYDSLERYINKCAKQMYFWNPYTKKSAAKFKVKYEDSKVNNGIQIADIIANTKGSYYNSSKHLKSNVKTKFGELEFARPLKLPRYWINKNSDFSIDN